MTQKCQAVATRLRNAMQFSWLIYDRLVAFTDETNTTNAHCQTIKIRINVAPNMLQHNVTQYSIMQHNATLRNVFKGAVS